MFGEQFTSKMKMVKSKHRNRLNNERLESCRQVATSHIHPDTENLVARKQ